MPVNHEIKSQLAKLLATEDLVVEHKQCSTAQFNVHTRVLTLPMWEKASETVYDMLVSHEVGHALYTPDKDWTEQIKVPPQFVNVVEDARIEKLMKRRYNGLNKIFYNGYKELVEDDFFSINDKDLNTFNLADRVNLWFKVGSYMSIPIDRGEETEIANLIADAETFDDALNAAVKLYEYCKEEQKQQEQVEIFVQSSNTGASNNQIDSSEQEQQEQIANDDESESKDSEENVSYGGTNSQQVDEDEKVNSEPEVKTLDSFNDAIQELVNMEGHENVYVELPKLKLDRVIGKNNDVHNCIQNFWNTNIQCEYHSLQVFEYCDNLYNKFKKDAQKEVNYLVKEFECRKAADSYARASVSRTGVLDCSKLHTYKYNEDLFRKVTTFADGKNHGLIFILDWSGSMSHILLDTLKQLYNIIWFCRKVNIPFEVYAFTNEWNGFQYDSNKKPIIPQDNYDKKENLVHIDREFSLMNIFTSKVNNKKTDEQMRNIFRIAHSFNHYNCPFTYPARLSLSGTPLNESLISLHQIIPQFNNENKLQKVHCVILTDGEAGPLPFNRSIKHNWESEPHLGLNRTGNNCFLRNRKTGMTYKINNHGYVGYTKTLLCDLKDSFNEVNFIGIRVIGTRDATNFIRNNTSSKNFQEVMNQWKKERSIAITDSGYHSYFGMSSTALSNEVAFQVDEDASKSTIRNAFKKSLNSKKMNKRFLNEFVKLVA